MYKYLKEKRTQLLFVPLVFYWLIIFIGTSLPSDELSTIIELGDKIKHFLAYLILAILLGLNLHFQDKWKNVSINYLLYTFIICTFYGVIDELHQIFVPNRSAEFYDWVADLFGSTMGIILVYFFIKFLKTRNHNLETN
ncbi:MAG: VanZ family protein [Melioribacteraceae bacterium]|nr:VanZ family protein [Melioribacteraceae bacterium]